MPDQSADVLMTHSLRQFAIQRCQMGANLRIEAWQHGHASRRWLLRSQTGVQ